MSKNVLRPTSIEDLAKAIYWAAWELYPPDRTNPVSRMTKDEAWEKTSAEHRRMAKAQAKAAFRQLGITHDEETGWRLA